MGVAGGQQLSTRRRLCGGTPSIDPGGFASTGSAEIGVDDGGIVVEANIIGHPRQRRGILKQPKRSGRRRNMANVVKKRIDDREFQRTDTEEHEECEGKSSSARDLFLAAVSAKLEDGNIRAPLEFSVARIILL